VSVPAFSALGLSPPLLEALSHLGFSDPRPVQAHALPAILAGDDVCVRADTGSGKTVAFGLGVLSRLRSPLVVQGLVLCPTRELAEQVSGELRRLASRIPNVKVLTLFGGVPFAPQRASLKQGAHVVVGTPGRIEEHLRKGGLVLDELQVLVLDEADRLHEMGFEPQVSAILRRTPETRQTLLFSATYPRGISSLSETHQRSPRFIDVPREFTPEAASPSSITVDDDSHESPETAESIVAPNRTATSNRQELFIRVQSRARISALARWVSHAQPETTLVFCGTRAETVEVAEALRDVGWVAASLHGQLSQRERQHLLRLFANGSCSVLAATDIAARGWDLPNLSAVVNFGLSRDPTVHEHRAGRTGRGESVGTVVSLVGSEDEPVLRALERRQAAPVTWYELPAPVAGAPPAPRWATLLFNAGKDKKLRPGDVLGALTAGGIVNGADVGAINVEADHATVAVRSTAVRQALSALSSGRIKGRTVKAVLCGLELPGKVSL
jgi:ATP-dependent RNA helicase DbpA